MSNNKLLSVGFLPSGDHVKLRLIAANATPDQVDNVLWLLNYGRANRIQSISSLARRLNTSGTTLSRVFSGKYGASLDSFNSDVEHFRKLEAERIQFGEEPIIKDLRVVRDITDFCELTRVSCTVSILFGPNQSGKSWALQKIYAPANNHGRTIYVSMLDSGGATNLFLRDLMSACAISERKCYGEMRQRALRYFDPQTLLIVDEFHQTMIGRTLKMASIEAIRAIYERCGCGVVLCGTDIIPDMFNDPKYKKFLGQMGNRGVLRRLIPAQPYPEDVRAICKAYGFPVQLPEGRVRELVKQISITNGIGKLCKYLRMSKRLAAKRKTAPGWDHFLETHATLQSWEKGEAMKRAAAGSANGSEAK